MSYSQTLQYLMILSSDNKFELVKVNIDNQESIVKKLIRIEKRKTLKRKRDEVDEDGEDIDALEKV
jgi:predicted N-acyltransferase